MAKSKNDGNESSGCSAPCCCRAFLIIFVILGLLVAVIGVLGVLFHEDYFMSQLAQKIPLSPTSTTLASFKKPPADIFMSFRFFNVTNSADVTKNGAKPIVVEIGPYVYKNRRSKENISFNDEGTEIFFEQRKYYEFDKERSAGSEDDIFINLDLVGYKVAKSAYDEGKIRYVAKTLSSTRRTSPFTSHVVKEFLFGVRDRLLEKVLPLKFPDVKDRPPARFGILIDKKTGESKHGKLDANYTLNTGKKDLSKYQSIVNFNGMEQLSVWPTNANLTDPVTGDAIDPNDIRGTPGTGFAPGSTKDSKLAAFAADLCLSIDFAFVKPTNVGPINTLRFMVDVPNWRKTVGDLNRAMCHPNDRDDKVKCAQDGLINATSCKGAALIMSLPHMMYADEFYQNTTVGQKSDPEKHSIFIDVDPLTGAALNVAKRVQINVRLFQFKYKLYRELPAYTLMPIMWIEESGGVRPDGLERLNNKVHGKLAMLKNGSYILLIVGVALIPVTIIIFLVFKQCYRSKHQERYEMDKRYGVGTNEEKHPLA